MDCRPQNTAFFIEGGADTAGTPPPHLRIVLPIERFDRLIEIRGVFDMTPFLLGKAHKETAGTTLDPDLIICRALDIQGGLTTLWTGEID